MADKIRVLLTEEEVNKRISEVAEQINRDYAGRHVHLICILKGGVFFTCELAKRLDLSGSLDFYVRFQLWCGDEIQRYRKDSQGFG